MKKFGSFLIAALLVGGAIFTCNYLLNQPVAEKLVTDPRNAPVKSGVHYAYYINPGTLVFNLSDVQSGASTLDVFRVLLQTSEILKDKDFTTVVLAFHGEAKFQLAGDYFKQLGKEFATQNPLYTMRTFAEHVQHTDGTPAYGKVEGGWLGVMSEEMGQFKDLAEKWYLHDLNLKTE